MFCSGCGQPMEPGYSFCPRCGAPAQNKSSGEREVGPADPAAAVVPSVIPQPQPAPHFGPSPAERSRLPLMLVIVAVLVVLGAAIAYWILHSSMPQRRVAPPSNINVSLTPGSAQVIVGNALDFAATVTGADNPEVTWWVREGAAGGRVVSRGARAMGGKVSLLAVYIAPKQPGTYHLLVTCKADTMKSAAAEITVIPR
jgi:Immunoglobulin I-set domain